ncbi:hypothetical protein BOTBODRAFT_168544 [Botryobasidium botryosum FD-172 SS1]|uniref:MIOS-like alpha-solenoid domain-containing protein n=1 Tax=Botryobasidium botryosum (strain FD-172 SS1) TaxID=930990 RepID=A0A067N032_BOTB1|nr:hypothetical protein BOTBODRAFT_168544 [Botryobasidium botryosum FD-172 SS1]
MQAQPIQKSIETWRTVMWDPHGSSRFIASGSNEVKLYEWVPNRSKIRLLNVQSDLPLMRARNCMAWSPHSSYKDLIAVGLGTGQIDFIRLDASLEPTPDSHNSFGSPWAMSYNNRPARAFTCLAFSPADSGYLAAGLDRSRGEPGLLIWSVENAPANPVDTSRSTLLTPRSLPQSPLDFSRPMPLGPPETVSSITFVPSTPSLLIAGTGHRSIRLFDLRSSFSTGSATDFIQTKSVYGLCADPFNEYRIASHGDELCHLWDRRRLREPVLAFAETDAGAKGKASGISTITFSHSRRGVIGTLEKQGNAVQLWDIYSGRRAPADENRIPYRLERRSLPEKAMRAQLATPRSTRGSTPEYDSSWAYDKLPLLAHARTAKSFNRHLSSFTFVPTPPAPHEMLSIITVAGDGSLDISPVPDLPRHTWSPRGSFVVGNGFSTHSYSADTSGTKSTGATTPAVEELNPDAQHEKIRLSRSPQRPFVFPETPGSTGHDKDNLLGIYHNNGRSAPLRMVSTELFDGKGEDHAHTSKSARAAEARTVAKRAFRQVRDDISMVIKRRVIDGYGIADTSLNAAVVEHEPDLGKSLAGVWEWLGQTKVFLDMDTNTSPSFDFTFKGVQAIWEGFPPTRPIDQTETSLQVGPSRKTTPPTISHGPSSAGRAPKRSQVRQRSAQETQRDEFDKAVNVLMLGRFDGRGVPALSVSTTKVNRRILALSIVGWDFPDDEFQEEMKAWEEDGMSSKAACWAVFLKHYELAIELLMRNERHQALSGTIAVFLTQASAKQDSVNVWHEHCKRMALRIDDPYLRVMLSHLANETWSDILEDESLPLLDRLSIALRFLNDSQLTSYLRRLSTKLTKVGDIQGLLLTGLTPSGMGLLQNYVNSTGDVQTAAILGSFVVPASFKDVRVVRWVEAYHALLDGWQLFHLRCRFDIERGEMFKRMIASGKVAPFEWVHRQLSIRCNYCNRVVNSREPLEVVVPMAALSGSGLGVSRAGPARVKVSVQS